VPAVIVGKHRVAEAVRLADALANRIHLIVRRANGVRRLPHATTHVIDNPMGPYFTTALQRTSGRAVGFTGQ
jgi:hypothetical protein